MVCPDLHYLEWIVPIWRASCWWPIPVTIFFQVRLQQSQYLLSLLAGIYLLAETSTNTFSIRISNHLSGSIKRFFKPELKILLVLHHIWNTKICHLCLVHKVSHLIGLELSFMMLPLVSLSRALNILNLKSDHFSFYCLLFCWFSSIL